MFTPAPSARGTQRVCGPPCRKLRDNQLARSRRRADLDDARADERERQRKHRASTPRAAASAFPVTPPMPLPRHAPPSDDILSKLLRKIILSWSATPTLSRATLAREFTVVLERCARRGGARGDANPAMSRATLDAQRVVPQAPG
jgi:hypothetical protein